jgi:hypothetical protein
MRTERKLKMKYQTEMTFPVELTFEVLPAMQVEDTELPAQLDITKILGFTNKAV